MGVEVRIGGVAEILKLSKQIKATGDKGLGRQMSTAVTKAMEPVKLAITASAETTMPSGYAPTLTRSMKHRVTTRASTRTASVRMVTTAAGEKETRDLPRLEKGELRHPVFGRVRRTRRGLQKNPWSTTRVEPGFHRRGTEDAADEAEKALGTVLDDFAARLAKG